jgi:hypothetical protein
LGEELETITRRTKDSGRSEKDEELQIQKREDESDDSRQTS